MTILKKKNDAINTTSGADGTDWTRTILAIGLPLASILLLILINLLYYSTSTNKADAAQTIFNSQLPLIGTWVGTVLAFYFSSHNFDVAAKHARDMVNQVTPREKLQLIIVKDVWIPMDKAITLTLDKDGENAVDLKTDMIDKLEKKGYQRLPILDMNGCVKYVVHRSMIDRFIVKSLGGPKDPKDLKLADMIKDDDVIKVLPASFRTLRATSNLADAKDFIDKIEFCQDVFATEDGTEKTKALGWVTNVIIEEQASLDTVATD